METTNQNNFLFALAALVVGLVLGACGGYYYATTLIGTNAAQVEGTVPADENPYADVNVNPYNDVKINPFE